MMFGTARNRCLEHQAEAQIAAHYAMRYRDDPPVLSGQAIREQHAAAYHHEEMRLRLELLIGVS
jgi:hypothetical protein